MPSGLLQCAHCDGAPTYIAGRLQAVIVCEECGISTPPVTMDADKNTAFTRLSAIWNSRIEHRPADQEAVSMMSRRALTSSDIPYFLNLLAATTSDWETVGPKFAAMAAALAQPGYDFKHVDPPETVVSQAARYQKLLQRAKIIYVDGAPMVRFEPVPALCAEIAEEALADREWPLLDLHEFIGKAIDGVPDHWQP
ncbi:Lar family restriction alleviation protein [Cupriavidus consociatus]|uniref:Lar family restriction alleviation protein n=1 Tax=Cupriavidus consociatus TaxID=2821357 RepID=UPI001AE10D5F|nr:MULTISPECIES: Lar family restriction alleviation protein [unclassified Cupriavidus]MBP0624758.1 Lar family restriction alleviation protein [Cupriavidus sp. LEh25]MDK2661475.1 Lar family restriction alleviation protein [Cupriavidus sp. LEh21]